MLVPCNKVGSMDLISENLKEVTTPSDPTSENLGGAGGVGVVHLSLLPNKYTKF